MKCYKWELIAVLLTASIIGYSSAQHLSFEKTAYDSLKLADHKCCTPAVNSSHTLKVNYGMALIDVASFDHRTGEAEFIIWERMQWTDFRLTWDPSAHNGVKVLRIDPEELWTPDMRTYVLLASELHRGQTKAVLYSNGNILWIPTTKLKTRCMVMDDTIKCSFKVGSWTYDGHAIDPGFYEGQAAMDVSDFVSYKGQFEIVENAATKNVVYYPCCTEPYPNIQFNLTLRHSEDSSAGATKAVPFLFAFIVAMSWMV